ENLAYLELRYTPYYRTDEHLNQTERIEQMRSIVEIVGQASKMSEYPIITSQILCMHSRLPSQVNKAIVDLALEMKEYVCAIDIAGGDSYYQTRLEEFAGLYSYAREEGLNTTGHLYETKDGCYPQLLPYLQRIGHGIQIPQTGTLESLSQLKIVFDRCFEAGVDIAICTDNAGLHNVRLPFEYENLLTLDVIDFRQLQACQDAAFRHAFAWPYSQKPASLLTGLLSVDNPKLPVYQ
ncbi:MAG: adenosine deaminase, partial [Microcystis sp. 53602_E8]|nr:adenosine deaminase [Microcystis sp. 53602_E8]